MSINRKEFYSPMEIFEEVSGKVAQLQDSFEQIDYLTFVPDGEPTLDINLGKEIELLKQLGIKIAVITNSSLLWDEDVRNNLMKANWVSLKIDAVDEKIWQKINRPNGKLELKKIVSGIKKFALSYKGELVTETMLVKDINDNSNSLIQTAELIRQINPKKSYILVPTRPPAEEFVEPPSEENLNSAYQIFNNLLGEVELLAYNEGIDFTFSSNAEKELLSILSVHPMRKEAVENFLIKAKVGWELIDNLINKYVIKEVRYAQSTFFVKNLKVKINVKESFHGNK
jgi:wyosine [tRNA(Phe)-imidazoG37] synthetase (radical SAM superfamily)